MEGEALVEEVVPLRVGSLFTGVGGMDLGLECAGMEVAWQVEINPYCRQVLKHRWPGVTRYEDVMHVGSEELEPVDLICGGFPCQDVSVAGRREGLAGERSGLFHELMRIARALAPHWLLIENVPGLLSSNGGRDMGAVLGSLAEVGYGYAYRVLDTQYFGPPQRRRRVFIVGHRGGWCPPEVLFEPESVPGGAPPHRAARKVAPPLLASGAGTARTGGPRLGSEEKYIILEDLRRHSTSNNDLVWCCPPVAPTLRVGGREQGAGNSYDNTPIVCVTGERSHTLTSGGSDASEDGTGRGTPIIAFNATQDPITGPKAGALSGQGAAVYRVANTFMACNAKGPLPSCGVGNVAVSVGPGGVCPPRKITPRECERLQGWPDDWTRWGVGEDGSKVEISDTRRYQMTGNGVSAPVAEWIGRRIMRCQAGDVRP